MYGRSIGGIAASHLTAKFPDHIKVFVGDRTLGDFDSMLRHRYHSGGILMPIFRCISCGWKIDNGSRAFVDSPAFKIHCFDHEDDTVDVYASHHH